MTGRASRTGTSSSSDGTVIAGPYRTSSSGKTTMGGGGGYRTRTYSSFGRTTVVMGSDIVGDLLFPNMCNAK
jgi:hypothetical protein